MDIPEIDVATAAQRLAAGDTLFVDVRDGGSFSAAHIPGARHVSDATLADFLAHTDRAQKLVVYCYHGNSSMGGTAYFLEQGFEDVASMSGGFEAWRGTQPHESA